MQERINYKEFNFQSAREILGGKNIVFTGKGFLVRGELMRLARQAGANVDSLVTKKCDILIVGEKPGSKLRKAKVLGCDIITISDFRDILEGKIKKDKIEIDDTLNIDLGNEETIGINILRKNIKLLINNEAVKERIVRNIKLNGGSIVNNIDENTDILVYQPNSEINDILKVARRLNIELFTLGSFNNNLIFKR